MILKLQIHKTIRCYNNRWRRDRGYYNNSSWRNNNTMLTAFLSLYPPEPRA